MKKLLALLLAGIMVFALVGCGSGSPVTDQPNNDVGQYEEIENNDNNSYNKQDTHVHNYSKATCTQASVCSCGATNGAPLGHKWKSATCQTPKSCTVCGATEGNKAEHNINGQGVCDFCGQDVFLEFVKENVSINLIVPSVGASDNYYCEVKFINHTGHNMTLSRFVTANGKMCDNSQAQDYTLETDYSVKISFYRATIAEDRWENKYKDMYLDNNSTATTAIRVNGRQAVVKFGTNGIIDVGNKINELD